MLLASESNNVFHNYCTLTFIELYVFIICQNDNIEKYRLRQHTENSIRNILEPFLRTWENICREKKSSSI